MLIVTILSAARQLLADRRHRRNAIMALALLHRHEESSLQIAFDATPSSEAAIRSH